MMRLEFYRIFVAQTQQQTLLSDLTSKHEAFFDAVTITDPLYFKYHGEQYALILEKVVENQYILARLGKKSSGHMRKSPEENFDIEYFDDWPAVPLIINLDGSPDTGQSIVVGISNKVVKKPLPLLEVLVDKLSDRIRPDSYELKVNPISEVREFWRLVRQFGDGIKEIDFCFTAPNLFNASSELDNDLKAAGRAYNATQLSIKLENKEGGIKLSEDQPFTKRAAEYISDGGGRYSMKVKGYDRTIHDGESIKSTRVEEFEITADDEDALKKVCDRIFSCLDSSE